MQGQALFRWERYRPSVNLVATRQPHGDSNSAQNVGGSALSSPMALASEIKSPGALVSAPWALVCEPSLAPAA
jgi:hypothetical protein